MEVNGVPLQSEAPVYFIFYKPRGVISAVTDDKNRKVVTDFFPHIKERIYPIGRLDYDTSGLLLLTNDGEFANHLMHPKNEVDKVYVAKVKGIPFREKLKKLQKGIKLEDGITAPAKIKVLSIDKRSKQRLLKLRFMKAKSSSTSNV